MEKIHSKSNLKVKSTAASTATPRGMRKEERAIEKPKASPPRSCSKENTKPQEFKLHSQERAIKRAMFNYFVATKVYVEEHEKRQLEKLQKMIEEEEVKSLRKKMVPRAQLMPFFDRPFFPQRSNRALTMPKEPSLKSGKCMSCVAENGMFNFHHHQTYY
ncbi:unnamed protein product [Linum tenue]|uniref:TPX2 C-terminal domain-containing protein n=1 Tax=Linum tenue TaxID=586396 RepID=A0AAV0S1L9_9ROSI|nr:unnamed protein product [Linum tenue]